MLFRLLLSMQMLLRILPLSFRLGGEDSCCVAFGLHHVEDPAAFAAADGQTKNQLYVSDFCT